VAHRRPRIIVCNATITAAIAVLIVGNGVIVVDVGANADKARTVCELEGVAAADEQTIDGEASLAHNEGKVIDSQL
jgi:hypothetical protein